MTLTIDGISPELESRLRSQAEEAGLNEAEYARRLLEDALRFSATTAPLVDQATLDLLSRWDDEDQTANPAEVARRQHDWEQFKASINAHSLSNRPVYP